MGWFTLQHFTANHGAYTPIFANMKVSSFLAYVFDKRPAFGTRCVPITPYNFLYVVDSGKWERPHTNTINDSELHKASWEACEVYLTCWCPNPNKAREVHGRVVRLWSSDYAAVQSVFWENMWAQPAEYKETNRKFCNGGCGRCGSKLQCGKYVEICT